MKKIVLLLIIAVIIVGVVFISINGKDAVVPMNDLEVSTIVTQQLNTVKGVSLGRVKYDIDQGNIRFTLKNKTKDNIYYGVEIILEKKQNGEWYTVPYSGEVGFTNELNYLSPSEKIDRTLPINTWIPLTPGEYRIIMEVSLIEGFKNLQLISGYFRVSDLLANDYYLDKVSDEDITKAINDYYTKYYRRGNIRTVDSLYDGKEVNYDVYYTGYGNIYVEFLNHEDEYLSSNGDFLISSFGDVSKRETEINIKWNYYFSQFICNGAFTFNSSFDEYPEKNQR